MANEYLRAFGVNTINSPVSSWKTMIDKILIQELELEASIGVFEWEKKIKQRLVFDLELFCDFSKASLTDDIDDAINYALVCAEIETLISSKHYQLLEFLAAQLCHHLFDCFEISAIQLTIYKPEAVAKTKNVGVSVFRERTAN
jgi:dihydroneopterin aldolase